VSPNTRDAIVRRRKQGFGVPAIAGEFDVAEYQVKMVLKEAGVHPYAQCERPKMTREEELRRRSIRALLDEGEDRHILEMVYGPDVVEEVAGGR